jgi:hypothetical protein
MLEAALLGALSQSSLILSGLAVYAVRVPPRSSAGWQGSVPER